VDFEILDLIKSPVIVLRCLYSAKNMQPEGMRWNLMGMLNNSWYAVKPEMIALGEDKPPAILFRHPTEAASLTGVDETIGGSPASRGQAG